MATECPICCEESKTTKKCQSCPGACESCWNKYWSVSVATDGKCVFCPNDVTDAAIEKFKTWTSRVGLDQKPHQIEGVSWCITRENGSYCDGESIPTGEGKPGGIIADEMGLGKTILMIGLMLVNFRQRSLIIVPPALLKQWEAEIERLTGHTPIVYHGYKKSKITAEQFLAAPIVLTTYGMVSKKTKNPLMLVKWDRTIFDEAHHMRNQRNAHKMALRLKSDITWMLTGTPIQNDITDLNALWKMLKININYTELYLGSGELLKRLIRTYILRRTKADAGLELPDVIEEVIRVEWESESERDLCEELHSALEFSNSKFSQSPAAEELTHWKLAAMVRCRQSCVKPQLLQAAYMNIARDYCGEEEMSKCLEPFLNKSKINAVVKKIVDRKDNGRKKLIFSHYRGEIDELKTQLEQSGLCVAFFDGRVSSYRREIVLTEDTADVLILQIKTACEGLNLQQFKEVYLVTPHWNPAVEDQAIARCHRIGQTENINVFRFLMEDFGIHTKNIDSYCRAVQERKRDFLKFINN